MGILGRIRWMNGALGRNLGEREEEKMGKLSEGKGSEEGNILIIFQINALIADWLRFKHLSRKTRIGGFSLDIRGGAFLVVVFVDGDFGGFALAAFGGGCYLGFCAVGGFGFGGLRG